MYFVYFSFSIIYGGTLYTQGGGHCPQNAHKARPKSTFLGYVFVMSWLTVSFLQGGSFPVVDKYLGCIFICTSRASGRGIITMDTGYTDLSTEQTYIVTN